MSFIYSFLGNTFASMSDKALKVKAKREWQKVQNRPHKLMARIPQPELSAGNKREIAGYWSQFGFTVKDYGWFQWYYGLTGIRDPRFIPQEYYYYTALPYYNRQTLLEAYKDKNAFDRILPADRLPKTIVKRISGDFYDGDGRFLAGDAGSERLTDAILAYGQVIVKNALDSGCGKNVQKYDVHSAQDVKNILAEWTPRDYIIQEVVRQHPFFAQFNESSVNIIRINSWYHDGEVTLSAPVIRFGMPGHATDVCFIDGDEIIRLLGVTDEGAIRDTVVYMLGETLPLSEIIQAPMRQVPAWDALTEMVRDNAKRLPHFHLIGWDVTVTEDCRPVTIEYNIKYPGTIPTQMTNGPMWGEHTDALFSFLKDEENRKKYIL